MEKRYAKIIAKAFQTVLETFSTEQVLGTDINNEHSLPQDIMVMIGMEGDVDGHVYMSMSAKAGKMLASNMLGGIDLEGANEVVRSAVSELCNMVIGNACTDIGADNKVIDIRPPVIVPELDQSHLKNLCSIKIEINNHGKVGLDVSLEQAV